MPCFSNTYTVPFDPIRNGPGEFATAKETFNRQRFVQKRGSRTAPYPSFVDVYQRSERTFVDADPFNDLYLDDFVQANKRWGGVGRNVCYFTNSSRFRVSQHRLRDDSFISRNLRGLLERGVQKSMDAGEPKGLVDPSAPPLAIEAMLGYTGSVRTALWYKIGKDRGKVC
jgi:hypothetical protein